MICHIDDGNANTFCKKVFRYLKADEARTANNGPADFLRIDLFTERNRVFRRTHIKNVGKVDAGNRRDKGRSARSDHKLIVAVSFFFSGVQVPRRYPLVFTVNGNGFCLRNNVRTGERGKTFGRIYNKLPAVFDYVAYIVGQSAARIRNILAFGNQKNFNRTVFPFQLGRNLCSCGNATDNHYFHNNTSFYLF